MNTLETIKERPGVAALAGGLLLVGVAVMFMRVRGSGVPVANSQAYFTVDDGKTWFADDATKLPPFDKDGKQAVRAYVYRSANGNAFVNCLERFKPEAKRALEDASKTDPNAKGPPDTAAVRNAFSTGRELKRPGDATWIPASNYRDAGQIMNVKCPDGAQNAVPLEP